MYFFFRVKTRNFLAKLRKFSDFTFVKKFIINPSTKNACNFLLLYVRFD